MNMCHFYNKEEKWSFCKDFLVKESLSSPALAFPPVLRGWFFMDTVDRCADPGKHDEASQVIYSFQSSQPSYLHLLWM